MVAGELDSLGRRKRTTPVSTGKHITPQEADYLWFQKLHQHGPLPSSYLLEYTAHLRKSQKRASERLTDLFNENETRHGGPYLIRPLQQFRTIDSRYNQLVYDLGPPALKALVQKDPNISKTTTPSGPWLHRFMISCVTASIELATLKRPDISFIPQSQILERAKADLRCPVSITDPNTGRKLIKDLIPDALFGLQYQTVGGNRFRFFAVECDRATEPATSNNFNRKSWLRNLLQYREYIVQGLYRDHLQLTAPLLVLSVTTDTKRQEKMLSVTKKEAGIDGNSYLLFQHWGDFGPVFRPPLPRHELLELPWQRAGYDAFCISKP